jgi:hypothetical protein
MAIRLHRALLLPGRNRTQIPGLRALPHRYPPRTCRTDSRAKEKCSGLWLRSNTLARAGGTAPLNQDQSLSSTCRFPAGVQAAKNGRKIKQSLFTAEDFRTKTQYVIRLGFRAESFSFGVATSYSTKLPLSREKGFSGITADTELIGLLSPAVEYQVTKPLNPGDLFSLPRARGNDTGPGGVNPGNVGSVLRRSVAEMG